MGALVKSAQAVEERVKLVHQEFEPRLQSKLKEAKAGWFELKSRNHSSPLKAEELRLRAFLLRTDAKLRLALARLIGKIIVELEKAKRTLPSTT